MAGLTAYPPGPPDTSLGQGRWAWADADVALVSTPITPQRYSTRISSGKRNISLLNIERLARALGVSLAELMPGTGGAG